MKHNIINHNQSIINMIDIVMDYLEINICNLESYFNRYMNYIFEYNNISFEDLRNIIKSFNQNKYYITISLLNDLKKRIIKETKLYLY